MRRAIMRVKNDPRKVSAFRSQFLREWRRGRRAMVAYIRRENAQPCVWFKTRSALCVLTSREEFGDLCAYSATFSANIVVTKRRNTCVTTRNVCDAVIIHTSKGYRTSLLDRIQKCKKIQGSRALADFKTFQHPEIYRFENSRNRIEIDLSFHDVHISFSAIIIVPE